MALSKIDDCCRKVVEEVDGAIACGVVDLSVGMLLGIHNDAGYPQELNALIAASTLDLFRGPNTDRIEQLVREHRRLPEDGAHYLEEVHIASRHNHHFAKAIAEGRAVLVLVTEKSTSVGMGWAELKSVIPLVEPLLP